MHVAHHECDYTLCAAAPLNSSLSVLRFIYYLDVLVGRRHNESAVRYLEDQWAVVGWESGVSLSFVEWRDDAR